MSFVDLCPLLGVKLSKNILTRGIFVCELSFCTWGISVHPVGQTVGNFVAKKMHVLGCSCTLMFKKDGSKCVSEMILWTTPPAQWRCLRTVWVESCAIAMFSGVTLLEQGCWTRWPHCGASAILWFCDFVILLVWNIVRALFILSLHCPCPPQGRNPTFNIFPLGSGDWQPPRQPQAHQLWKVKMCSCVSLERSLFCWLNPISGPQSDVSAPSCTGPCGHGGVIERVKWTQSQS